MFRKSPHSGYLPEKALYSPHSPPGPAPSYLNMMPRSPCPGFPHSPRGKAPPWNDYPLNRDSVSTIQEEVKDDLKEYTIITLHIETIQENGKNEQDIIQIGCTAFDISKAVRTKFFEVIQPPRIKDYLAMKLKGDLLKCLNIQKNNDDQFEFRKQFEIIEKESDIIKCTTEKNALDAFSSFLLQYKNPLVVSLDDNGIKLIIKKLKRYNPCKYSTILSYVSGFCSWKSFLVGTNRMCAEISMEFEDFIENNHLNKIDMRTPENPNAQDISFMLINAVIFVKRTSQIANLNTSLPQICIPIQEIAAQIGNKNPQNNDVNPLKYLEISNNWRLSAQIQVEHVDTYDLLSDSEEDDIQEIPQTSPHPGKNASDDAFRNFASQIQKQSASINCFKPSTPIMCIPCNKIFKCRDGLTSHLRQSKKHGVTINEEFPLKRMTKNNSTPYANLPELCRINR